jgi:hypothetical protein
MDARKLQEVTWTILSSKKDVSPRGIWCPVLGNVRIYLIMISTVIALYQSSKANPLAQWSVAHSTRNSIGSSVYWGTEEYEGRFLDLGGSSLYKSGYKNRILARVLNEETQNCYIYAGWCPQPSFGELTAWLGGAAVKLIIVSLIPEHAA